jgi:hypothetical protein
MSFLERLQPRWRRSDPEVRAAAVREMGARDQARLETLARSDPDAKVRRIAIKKLEDPERLDAARGQTDEDLRPGTSGRGRSGRRSPAPTGRSPNARRRSHASPTSKVSRRSR